jgi:hypothetical protein
MAKFVVFEKVSESIFRSFPKKDLTDGAQTAVNLGSGLIAGFAAAIVSQPADTMLSKINKTKGLPGEGTTSRLIKIARELGLRGSYSGIGARLFMVGTLTAGQFAIYGDLKKALGTFTPLLEGHQKHANTTQVPPVVLRLPNKCVEHIWLVGVQRQGKRGIYFETENQRIGDLERSSRSAQELDLSRHLPHPPNLDMTNAWWFRTRLTEGIPSLVVLPRLALRVGRLEKSLDGLCIIVDFAISLIDLELRLSILNLEHRT